jgi:hypothetical protein
MRWRAAKSVVGHLRSLCEVLPEAETHPKAVPNCPAVT